MKILLATDGSEFSFAATRKCCEMISFGEGTTIKIFNVIETVTPAEPFGMTDKYYAIVQKTLRGVAEDIIKHTRQLLEKSLGETGVEMEAKIIRGYPKEAIIAEAEKWEADLIVVGSHGRGFWGRMFLGSVSDAVVKHSPCSVLIAKKDNAGGNEAG